MLTAKQVADYFLTLVDSEAGDALSNLKLQKLGAAVRRKHRSMAAWSGCAGALP